MKRAWFFLCVSFVMGCAVTTVEYRYKQRFDHFYKLLNDKEKSAFRADDFATVGKSLEERMSKDKNLSNAMDRVMFDEAIHTFRMDQVAMFFKRYILPGFHEDDYATFVQALPQSVLLKFALWDKTVVEDIQALLQKDKRLGTWWRHATTDGRLGDFSLAEAVSFYRWYIFVEKTRKEVYSVVKFLYDQKLLKAFLENMPEFGSRLEKLSQEVVVARELKVVKRRAFLSSLGDKEFFQVYREVVFREMDQEALAKTIAMFPVE
ncbi:MAG: hypothetical protein N2314_00505 [Brevinematales bacterium]|nr:hypothetical protein [Brevinematales bacterium]